MRFTINTWPRARILHARHRYDELIDSVMKSGPTIRSTQTIARPGQTLELKVEEYLEDEGYELSLRVGEILNALKGALDSTVWQIQQQFSPVWKDVERSIYFPITRNTQTLDNIFSPEDKRGRPKPFLGAPEPLKTRIKYLNQFTEPQGFARYMLILNDLNNQDKHRTSVTLTHHSEFDDIFSVIGHNDTFPDSKEVSAWLKTGTPNLEGEVVRVGQVFFRAEVPHSFKRVEVDKDLSVRTFIRHEDYGLAELEYLQRMIDFVEASVAYIRTGAQGVIKEFMSARGSSSGTAFFRK